MSSTRKAKALTQYHASTSIYSQHHSLLKFTQASQKLPTCHHQETRHTAHDGEPLHSAGASGIRGSILGDCAAELLELFALLRTVWIEWQTTNGTAGHLQRPAKLQVYIYIYTQQGGPVLDVYIIAGQELDMGKVAKPLLRGRYDLD